LKTALTASPYHNTSCQTTRVNTGCTGHTEAEYEVFPVISVVDVNGRQAHSTCALPRQ